MTAWERVVVSRLDVVEVGGAVPTGRVVPRDVYLWVDDGTSDQDALTVALPVDSYPVSIAVVHWEQPPIPPRRRRVTGMGLPIQGNLNQ
ncbi:MAG: hypothetical protein QOG10_5237 [Kribbellaceae bacterium]|nr:hypothetical protein [Kribbellaceae bacterium]